MRRRKHREKLRPYGWLRTPILKKKIGSVPAGVFSCHSRPHRAHSNLSNPFTAMPRETVIIECTEARKEGKRPSRYMTERDKKKQQTKIEKMKYNPYLRRHTLHKEIKD
jgi:large subunit ribosomal protein L33